MLKVASLFSGIGSFEFALKRMNLTHEIVFACDNGNLNLNYNVDEHKKNITKLNTEHQVEYIDKLFENISNRTNFVKISYLENYKLNRNRFFQDIKLLNGQQFLKDDIDIIVGGSPCQSFSSVGSKFGLDDARGTLFYEFARIIKESKPKVFIYENVRGLYTHDKGNTWKGMKEIFKEIGYTFYDTILDAKEYGVPQTRRRLFVIGFRENNIEFTFPETMKLNIKAQDLLLDNLKLGNYTSKKSSLVLDFAKGEYDPKYFLSPKLKVYVMKGGTKSFYQKPEIDLDIARTVLATMGNRHRAGVDNYHTVNGKIRMLTEREAHRFMGFTDDYKIVVSRAQGYKQAGNSIVVDVLIKLIAEIHKTMKWIN